MWAGADRTVVSANTITECGQAGLYTEAVTNLVVADNTVIGCQLRGIEIDGTKAAGGTPTGTAIGVDHHGQRRHQLPRPHQPRAGHAMSRWPATAWKTPTRSAPSAASRSTRARRGRWSPANHAHQAHAAFPAIYVVETVIDVTLAWNAVQAAVPYQAPADTVISHRSGAGQIKTPGKIIAGAGIGVGKQCPGDESGCGRAQNRGVLLDGGQPGLDSGLQLHQLSADTGCTI